MVTESKKTQTKSVQNVDHSGNASVLAERHDSRATLIHHLLVVDQTNVLHMTYLAVIIVILITITDLLMIILLLSLDDPRYH